MLKVRKLEVVYHHISTAIQGVSFEVNQGDLFGLIGVNGAGKTTTLRAISGFLGTDNAEISDGEIDFRGVKLNSLSSYQISRMGVVLVPERNKVFDSLSTHENLAIISWRKTRNNKVVERIYEYFPVLKERKNILGGYLSGGERQMLAIGGALVCSPELLLIDELSQGLAPLIVKHMVETLLRLKKDFNLTVLLVEQNAAIVLNIADYAAVMENGRIVFDGPREKLLSHEDVREFYLGVKNDKGKSYRDVKQWRRSRRWWG